MRERDAHTCRTCGRWGGDAHHLFGRKAHPELRYVLDNGVTLCREHHDDAHKHPWLFRTFVQWYVLSDEAWLALCERLNCGQKVDLAEVRAALEAA